MTADQVKALIIQTLMAPAEAARVVSRYPAPDRAVWLGLALVGVLNGLYYAAILPSLARQGVVPMEVAHMPLIIALVIVLVFAAMVVLTTVCGRFLGGTATLPMIGKIMVWLQGLQFLARIGVTLISFISPLIGWLVSTVLGFWGIWILINFISATHEITVVKSLGVLLMMFVVMIFGISILTAIIGIAPPVPTGDS